MKEKSPKRPMTPDELVAISMLKGVSFGSGAMYDRRMTSHLFAAITPPQPAECNCGLSVKSHEGEFPEIERTVPQRTEHLADCAVYDHVKWKPMITERMAPQLWRILRRYRRQLKHPERVKYIRMAEKLMVPDYRTYEYRKAQEARYKIEAMKREAAQKEAV